MTVTTAPPGVLLVADVARIFNEEARKQYDARAARRRLDNAAREAAGRVLLPDLKPFQPIKAATVLACLKESNPMVGSKPGRYALNPMPRPAGNMGTSRHVPWWKTNQEKALRKWWNSRPGHGHGRGGWPAGRPRRPRAES